MRLILRIITFTIALLLFGAMTEGWSQTLQRQVIASGGNQQSGSGATLRCTFGQAVIGQVNSSGNSGHLGYWQAFSSGPEYLCGDASGDGRVNVSDAVYVIKFVFSGGNPPEPYQAGDANCDSKVNVSDAVWIINFVFNGGSPPCDC